MEIKEELILCKHNVTKCKNTSMYLLVSNQCNFHTQTNNGKQKSVQNKKRNGKAQEAQLTFAIERKFCKVNKYSALTFEVRRSQTF